MLAIRIFESELTAGVISATRWNPGAEMSIDFSKKTRHPFSLGSAAANLHSSYNSGTKSDKMRPIMRPAANRADNNSLFFSLRKTDLPIFRWILFPRKIIFSDRCRERSRCCDTDTRGIADFRRLCSNFDGSDGQCWATWHHLNVPVFEDEHARIPSNGEGDSVATPHSHSRRGGSIRVHSAHLSLRQNPNPNPARRAGATPAKIVQRF